MTTDQSPSLRVAIPPSRLPEVRGRRRTAMPHTHLQVTEHMSFNVGNAVKYLWRADLKGDPIEDLRKAAWYINREIQRRSSTAPCTHSSPAVLRDTTGRQLCIDCGADLP